MAKKRVRKVLPQTLEKCPTGISGLDDVTGGGLPRGRNSLICGGAGSGKTMLGMEFLVRGARDFGELGAVIAFEETQEELAENFASLGFDVQDLIASKRLLIDYVLINRDPGKSSFAAFFANAACARGERITYFAFEESPSQILRNMSSVGLNLQRWIKNGLLQVIAIRPTAIGLEGHLASVHNEVEKRDPSVVIMDPITNLISVADLTAVKAMLTRTIDFLKMRGTTALFTNLTLGEQPDDTAIGISSLMDTWVVLRDVRHGYSRQRIITVLKSRGMAHSNEIRAFRLDERGISILDSMAEAPNEAVSGGRVA